MKISDLAIVSKSAKIGPGVEIGPFAIVEDDVELGRGVKVRPHAYICSGTTVGDDTEIHMGAVIGHTPQDLAYDNKKTHLKIGKRNIIREYATIHRGTKEGTSTIIGDDCYFMAVSHVGHNCQIGNKVIVANGALLGGYVMVEDGAFISGNVVIHQFCRIGALSMIGGFTGINKDVPPYMLVRGPSVVRAINLVGLRRAKFSKGLMGNIRNAYKMLYASGINTKQALEEIRKMEPSKEIKHLIEFIENSKRGICKSRESDEEYFE